ncbi:MAG: hypothetical protein CMM47_03420 [Rhodospirillaceae bacterium]|nr:hypothetical protein [Rhodospirillaceae bacterium]
MSWDQDNKVRRDGRKPGLHAVGAVVSRITDPALRKRGFVESAVIHRWTAIVGSEVAGWCTPDRVAFPRDRQIGATLHLLVHGARGLELQHLEPVILERINTVFGYAALSRIAIRQGPVPEPSNEPRSWPRVLNSDEEAWVIDQVSGLRDLQLREALEALGRALLSRR